MQTQNQEFEMVGKTLSGLEETLAEELIALGANDVQIGRRMVSFKGDKGLLYKTNLYCRTALRILKPVYHFKAGDADTVYRKAKEVPWEDYISLDKTFAIDSVIHSEDFNHSKFVAYKTKDAIVDYFMEKYKQRPSVRVNNPDLYIHIHISHNDCTLSIDSSGESLHKRGYRIEQTEAPLNEVLAAGMVLKTGWRGESHFIDPMCGSGTLLIEAAMIALNIPPGIYRKEFAFEKWIDFDRELFDHIYDDDSNERKFTFKCYGSDISPVAVEAAEKNIRNAGLMKYIDLKVLPFQQYNEAPQPGIMVTNPPYGERISSHDLTGLYSMIGERMKHVFMGYKVWILSYKEECFEKIALRPCEKMKMMNGSLACEYRCYEMFEGKNKEYKKALSTGEIEDKEKHPAIARRDKPDRPARRFAAAHANDDPDNDEAGYYNEFQDRRSYKKPFKKKRFDK
jgi:putative N6-adenine-specific DNA methylase